jgi:predicted transcriptional regulator
VNSAVMMLDTGEQPRTPRFGFALHDRLSDETSPSREYDRLHNIPGAEMAGKNVLTVRVSAELQDRLDAIADAIDRRRSWVINRALEAFVESEAWQIEEIKRGLAEADAGDFASEAEVVAIFEKWRRVDPDAD